MSLLVPFDSAFTWRTDNWGTNPSATPGTSVTPGASNAEGAWTQIFSAVSNDVYGIWLQVTGGSTASAIKLHKLDIGVDPAGGSSYTAVVNNWICGNSPVLTVPGRQRIHLPLFIKSGSTIAVRVQGNSGTAGTVLVQAEIYGKPTRPEAVPRGCYSETIGDGANTTGTSFTPGNAADGAWVSLGTTSRPLWWWQLGYQISNITITAEYTYIEVAHGDTSNKHTILKAMHGGTTSEVVGLIVDPTDNPFQGYYPLAAGAELFVRGRCNNPPDTGYQASVVGIGG